VCTFTGAFQPFLRAFAKSYRHLYLDQANTNAFDQDEPSAACTELYDKAVTHEGSREEFDSTRQQFEYFLLKVPDETPSSTRVSWSIDVKGHSKKDKWETFPVLTFVYWDKYMDDRLIFLALRKTERIAAEPDSAEEVMGKADRPRDRKAEICMTFLEADGKETKLKARCTVSERLNDDRRLFWREVLPLPHTFKPDWVKAEMKDLAILKEAALQRYYKI